MAHPLHPHSRRRFLQFTALACLPGMDNYLRPGTAAAVAAPATPPPVAGTAARIFSREQMRSLETMCEALVPGSAAAGVADFIDTQLAGPAADSLLMIKYLGIEAPFDQFYRSGLAALDRAAREKAARPLYALSAGDCASLVAALAAGSISGWSGPPAQLVYFVLRNDAVDVVYGTPEGFAELGVPYMPHIAPPAKWR